jgi:hypothetical protein
MMAAKGAIKPVYEVMARRARSSTRRRTCRRSRLLHEPQGARCCRFRSTARPRVLVQQGRVREGGPRPNRAPQTGPKWSPRWPSSRLRARVPVHHGWQTWTQLEELLGVAQRAVPDQGERLSAARRASSCSTAGAGPHIENMQ